jgi:hypothetical protein
LLYVAKYLVSEKSCSFIRDAEFFVSILSVVETAVVLLQGQELSVGSAVTKWFSGIRAGT